MTIIKPHGCELINRYAKESEKEELLKKASNLNKLKIADRFISDCEMIANGGFSPLKGFMEKKEVLSVLNENRLTNGLIWTIPVVLPIEENQLENIKITDNIALTDKNDKIIAIMTISDIFELDLEHYCEKVYNTADTEHPGVNFIKKYKNKFIGGEIIMLNKPKREHINESYYMDPKETREMFEKKGLSKIVAFQTRNPIHRAHEYLIKCALESADGFLIHPLVGETKSDDIPAKTRMQCYEVLIENYFNKEKTMLSVLPAAMRYAGPKEAVHHMIIRQNYGCSHMIIGRDHAGVGDYYGTYEAQDFVNQLKDELEIKAIMFEHAFFCKKCGNLASSKTCPHNAEEHVHLSGTKVREMLRAGKMPPEEFSRKEVAQILINWATEK